MWCGLSTVPRCRPQVSPPTQLGRSPPTLSLLLATASASLTIRKYTIRTALAGRFDRSAGRLRCASTSGRDRRTRYARKREPNLRTLAIRNLSPS